MSANPFGRGRWKSFPGYFVAWVIVFTLVERGEGRSLRWALATSAGSGAIWAAVMVLLPERWRTWQPRWFRRGPAAPPAAEHQHHDGE